MIRLLFLLVVFCLGLGAAVLFFGQMHHLRLALPDALPGWTETLPDDAGLRDGRMPIAARGVWPAVELSWEAQAPGRNGLRWRVGVTGEGIDVTGDLTLSWWPDTARLSGVTGTVALAEVSGAEADLEGLLALRDATADARGLFRTPVVSGELSGALLDVRAGGADFGGGPVTGELQENGDWRAETQLDGGVSAASGLLSGTLPDRAADLEVTVARGQDLPTAFRNVLSQIGEAEGDGWRVTVRVPLF